MGHDGAWILSASINAHLNLMRAGDLGAHADSMREIEKRSGFAYIQRTLFSVNALWRGALEEAEVEAAAAERLAFGTGLATSAMIRVLAYAGQLERATQFYHEHRHLLESSGQQLLQGERAFLHASVEALALVGDLDTVAGLSSRVLETLEHGSLVRGDWLGLAAPVAGIAAACAKEWDQAAEHFERGLQQAQDLPHVIERPEIRRWYAWMLLRRDEPGDRDRAGQLLREAIVQYETLGMPLHLGIATKMLASIGANPETKAYPDGLTDREMDVLLLVAQNLRNKDIAESLTISPATVTRHVSNILNKTGFTRRGELVTYAYEHDLLDGGSEST
jgi:DNA-binding CsgD family transcriptional regulator